MHHFTNSVKTFTTYQSVTNFNQTPRIIFVIMDLLVLFEYSGIVRNAFQSAGFNAWSCDLLPSESPGKHLQLDWREALYSKKWSFVIAHYPCTFLAKAQIFKLQQSPGRMAKAWQSIEDIKEIFACSAEYIALENPIGFLSNNFRPPDQIIYPWMFGDPHSKDICLWLKNLPPLISTVYHYRRQPVSHHVNSRMSQALKSKIKSKFFPLVASAMAQQWSLEYLSRATL